MKHGFAFVISALLYFVAGRFGMLLAIPPGFSSAIWPAAGVALACALSMPRIGAILGVGFGSFCINVYIANSGAGEISFSGLSLSSLVVPLCIGLGAITQTVVGLILFTRFISRKSFFSSPKYVLRFMLIVAPVGCLVAACIGISVLYLNNIISSGNVLFSLITWYIGDTIGVIFFAPLILILLNTSSELSLLRKIQVLAPTMTIFLAVLLIYHLSSQSRHKAFTQEIHEDSAAIIARIEEHLLLSESLLGAYSAYFQLAHPVSRKQFNQFFQITLNQYSEHYRAISWIEIVSHGERNAVEERYKQEGFNEFSFTEFKNGGELQSAKERDRYFPVLYIFPMKNNARALGLDLGANKSRLEALLSAKELGLAVSTSPIVLAQSQDNTKALILYWPVYGRDEAPSNTMPATKNDNFYGYLGGVLDVKKILRNEIREAQSSNYGIQITDVTDIENPIDLIPTSDTQLRQYPEVKDVLEFGKRKFQVRIFANNYFKLSTKDWASWTILVVGFLIAAILQTFIGVLTGITENIRSEVQLKTRDLQRAKLAAEEANMAKSQFLANINHEIRTPLNAIKGMIHRCMKTDLNQKQADYLAKAQLALDTLLSLVSATLDFSKIEAGKLELEQEPFDLFLVVKKMVAIFSTQASDKNLEFECIAQSKLPRKVVGDQLRLEQIILNLLSNALKFTAEGKVTLSLSAELEQSTAKVTIVVSDSGIGISEDNMKTLFSSFQQADNSTTRKFGGTGLGLAISRQLASLMNGDIRVESEEGHGSRFIVNVELEYDPSTVSDIRIDDSVAEELQPNVSLGSAGENVDNTSGSTNMDNALSGLKILLVEDVPVNQEIAELMLTDFGANVIVAENGQEALDCLAEDRSFDIILMDIQMPVMDGFEATQVIREERLFNHIPIVAMTANASTSDIEKCQKLGMKGFISKPIDEEMMLQEILTHTKRS